MSAINESPNGTHSRVAACPERGTKRGSKMRAEAASQFIWRTCAAGGLVWLLLGSSPSVAAESDDSRFLDGLRSRRQFSLAAAFCRQRLQATELAPAQEAQVVVELLRILSEQALHAHSDDRDAFWQGVENVAHDFLNQHRQAPHSILVEVQVALADLARGELARIESELATSAEQSLESARQRLRAATRSLEEIDTAIGSRIGASLQGVGRGQDIEQEELRNLRLHVQRQLARALRNQALCYPEHSADRLAALTAAVNQLQAPLAARAASDSVGSELLLERAICLRLLGDHNGALETLEQLNKAGAPTLRMQLRAEQIRLHLAANDLVNARALVAQGRVVDGATSPDLDFAFLQSFVRQWRALADQGEDEEASRWRDRAVAAAEFIEKNHGGYWSRRADLALVNAGQQQGAASVAILSRTAADLYLKGQLTEACTVYDKAAASATEAGETAVAFDLAYKAALIQQQASQFANASERFRRLAVESADPRAHQSHLVAAINAADAVRAKQVTIDHYASLLDEHLETWPNAPTAATIANWQGQLREQQKNWSAAIESYRAAALIERTAAGEGPLLYDSVVAIARVWSTAIREVDVEAEQSALANEAIDFLDQFVFADVENHRFPAAWSVAATEAAFHAARLRLLFRPTETLLAARLLQESPNEAPGASETRPFIKNLIQQLALGINVDDAALRRTLEEIEISSSPQALSAFAMLSEIGERTRLKSDLSVVYLVRLQRALASRLRESRLLSADEAVDVERIYARAVAVLDRQTGLALLSKLADDNVADDSIRLEYAQQLTIPGSSLAELRRGLEQWRRVATRLPPRRSDWFEAKYSVAKTLMRLGENKAAAQRIRYLQVTEDLAEAGFAERFAALLSQTGE